MSEALEQLLRLVAEGKLTPEEAAPLVAALSELPKADGQAEATQGSQPSGAAGLATRVPRHVHIEVRDHGRQAINLRVPLALGHAAVRMVPGLASDYVQRVREALDAGLAGPIVDVVDDDGDGVRISLD
ncbi:MAG TPA: hypothetical protein VFW92_06550 [Candidatus Limnocylindrales bacterium]|nr:hypothetical protein [Candidatus Limnocylindrales bacterium]